MRPNFRWAALLGVVLIVSLGGYAMADAADIVPGPLTDDPQRPTPAPFPAAVVPLEQSTDAPIPSLESSAPIPSSAAVQAMADALAADPRVGESTGIRVVDIVTGQVLAEVDGDDPQIPASNAKLLTAAAVEYAIPADRTLETSVTWPGDPGGEHARLTLVAGGDMLLAADYGHQGESQSPNGYAGVADLADGIVAALDGTGVTTVDLVVDDHLFGGPSIPVIWKWENVTEGYAAPVSGLAINIALIPDTPEGKDPERYLDPSMQVGEVLKAKLEERGITVETLTRGVAGTGEVELASVQSAPISDITAYVVWYSENTIAELLLKLVALEGGRPGTSEAGTEEALRILAGQGLDTRTVTLVDGSGLSRGNRISPQVLTDLIVILARDPAHDSLLEQLPIAALRGTLYDRFRSTEAAGVIRGKTGSLTGVTSLSGTIVTADGRWLAYSILADGMPFGQTKPRAAIDEFLSNLAACGCG